MRFLYARKKVGEQGSERVAGSGTPEHTALAHSATRSDAQHELVRDSGGPHASNFRARIRKVAQNARTPRIAFGVADHCW